MPSVMTTTARRPSPWLARSLAARSRASWSAVEPKGFTSVNPSSIFCRSVVQATMPKYSLSNPARATWSSGCRAARTWRPAIRAEVVLSWPFMLPDTSTRSRTRAGLSCPSAKWRMGWSRPSSRTWSSWRRRLVTGRPFPSTAVAERTTSSERDANVGTWPTAGIARKARKPTPQHRDGEVKLISNP